MPPTLPNRPLNRETAARFSSLVCGSLHCGFAPDSKSSAKTAAFPGPVTRTLSRPQLSFDTSSRPRPAKFTPAVAPVAVKLTLTSR